MAVTTDGRREIVGLGIGPSEAEPFWSAFLKSLVKRGLKGVKLVISDAHEGLRLAITRVLGASWQKMRGIIVRRMGVIAMGRENRRKTRRLFTRRRHRGVATAFADSFQSEYPAIYHHPAGIAAEARDGAFDNRRR